MPNRIKDIFSEDMLNLDGELHFRDDEASKNFLAALEIVYAEGRVVPVDGVTSITTKARHQGVEFPFMEHTNISNFVVGPSKEIVNIPLIVDARKKVLTLYRSQLKDKTILRSVSDSIVSFELTFLPHEERLAINYKVWFEKAKAIEDIVESFSVAATFLETLPKRNNEKTTEKQALLFNVIKYFHRCAAFFQRLHAIENELDISISPSLLDKLSPEEQQDIDELYLLLCKKQVIRLNAKLTPNDSTTIIMNHSNNLCSIGSEIKITFLGSIEFNFLTHSVLLCTSNLLVNASIKDVQESSDGAVKILYGDTDSKPMYIAFSAYKTEEEAREELKRIPQHDEDYINALTSDVYIKHFYSEKEYGAMQNDG